MAFALGIRGCRLRKMMRTLRGVAFNAALGIAVLVPVTVRAQNWVDVPQDARHSERCARKAIDTDSAVFDSRADVVVIVDMCGGVTQRRAYSCSRNTYWKIAYVPNDDKDQIETLIGGFFKAGKFDPATAKYEALSFEPNSYIDSLRNFACASKRRYPPFQFTGAR